MKLAIIGDFDSNKKSHLATDLALQHSAGYLNLELDYKWLSTETIDKDFDRIVEWYDSFWIAPGGPYNDVNAALEIIKYARTYHKPAIGTCGGFQLMVLEYARNVLEIKDAAHAEYNPDALNLIISPLSCNIKGSPLEIEIIDEASQVFSIYGSNRISESYYCSYGINTDFQKKIHDKGFKIVGSDNTKEARVLELKDHPFFIATLFVPQVNSSSEAPNKLITAFLKTGMEVEYLCL